MHKSWFGKWCAVCLAVFLQVALCVTVNGAMESETIKVGYTLQSGTIKSPIVNGEEGYGYEYLNTIFDAMEGDYKLDFVYCSQQNAKDMLANGIIDLLGPMSREEIEETDDFLATARSFGNDYIFLSALATDDDYQLDYSDIEGSTIAVRKDDVNEGALLDFLEENHLDAEIVYFTEADLESLMTNFAYDFCLCTSMQTFTALVPVANLGATEAYYVATSGNQALIDRIDQAMEAVDQSAYLYREKLTLKYYDYDILEDRFLSEKDVAKLQEKSMYYIGIEDIYGPIGYMDINGVWTGVAVDVMEMIADAADIEYTFVEVNTESTSEELKKLDFAFLSYNVNGRTNAVEGEVFCEMPFVLIEHSDEMIDKEISNIGILSHYGMVDVQDMGSLFGREIVEFDDLLEMQAAYNQGRVESLILTTSNLNLIRRGFDDMNFSINILGTSLRLNLVFQQEYDPELMSIFNKIVTQLDTQEIDASILAHSTASAQTMTLNRFISEYPVTIVGLVILVAIAVVITISLTEKKRKRGLYHLLNYDKMTGVYSAHRFEEIAEETLRATSDTQYVIATIDIDNFKYVNDMFGYEVGNQVLKVVADTIPVITPTVVAVGRNASDVFMVLMARNFAREQNLAFNKTERNLLYSGLTPLIGESYNLSFSIGIYNVEDKQLDINLMVDCANIARMTGKQYARTTIHEYDKTMDSNRVLAADMIANMVKAIKEREFVVYYQPKIDLKTKRVVGAEALVRWVKNGKLLPPNIFIPLFEKNGFVEQVDIYVLEQVCIFLKANPHVPKISVNLSGVTIGKRKLVERILAVVDTYQIPHQRLEFEITETAFVGHFEDVAQRMQELRDHGFTIAMDDFGVGISSLSQLKNMPIDSLKIDRAFIVDSLSNAKGMEIIKNIINMAIGLELETVAEGIETQRQEQFLLELGCEVGQGYSYSRPLPEGEFLTWLRSGLD